MEKAIESLYEAKKYQTLRDILSSQNEADIASFFSGVKEEALPVLFRLLPKDLAADTFALMEPEDRELLIHGFSDSELKEVIDELYVDDAVDIVDEMPANVVKRILKNADPEKRQMINEILKYPEDSAGSLMTVEYISLRPKMTVSDAIKRIRRKVHETETIYTCYVTDDNRRLLGYISVRTLLLAGEKEKIEDLMDTPVCVNTLDDKEDVAKKMNKYDFVAMPVVDDEMRLVGIVTFDDAIDVLQEETTEDIEIMAAMAPAEESYFKTSDLKHARNRIVWLLVLMLSATLTGSILAYYESAFESVPILVSFIPMLMGTGGNCGSQSSTMIIRGMSVDEIQLKDFFKVVWMEFRISLILSFSLAIVNGLRILVFYRDVTLAVVISLSIIGTVIMAELIGCMLPMIAKKCRLDPAVMAAPIITTVVDALCIVLYFNIALKFFNI
ncbi:MAG TPA: magnesium transporter [Candidatus Ornithomonoglobus intestinigallinarum]|uniref:Magnesium transporter MgtE n=1 Tax=Candidatus Ornithomonoglobus intestinigallinarum TaxID=2840894 RepID=A0A9D1KP69_9FIRM|nr:magnesium transporter [Candidatus Ornithomonoglobus intestinigallinarum]